MARIESRLKKLSKTLNLDNKADAVRFIRYENKKYILDNQQGKEIKLTEKELEQYLNQYRRSNTVFIIEDI